MVYFYSEPLAAEVWDEANERYKLVSTASQQLSTENEYNRLVEILKSTQKQFRIMRQAVNFESLKVIISQRPSIIHISCHGDFEEDTKQFYLQFEGVGNGIVDRFNQQRMLDLLGDEKDHGIKLAFVSACYS